jgi:hypothetical protein
MVTGQMFLFIFIGLGSLVVVTVVIGGKRLWNTWIFLMGISALLVMASWSLDLLIVAVACALGCAIARARYSPKHRKSLSLAALNPPSVGR